MSAQLQVAVVGCGHMGAHHARVVSAHPECRLVAAVDVVPLRAQRIAAQHGCDAVETLPGSIDAVVVATPTTTHAQVAAPLVRSGAWCLVEKPLAASPGEALGLVGPRVGVGHSERFNPAIRAIGSRRPLRVEARRMGTPRDRCLDVDVVADLMVHDIDLVLHWSQGEVCELQARGRLGADGRIESAWVGLRMSDGLHAEMTASRVAHADERTVRLYERGRFTALDLLQGRAKDCTGALPVPLDGDALTAQWAHFVDAVRGRATLAVDAGQAMRRLQLVAQIRATLGDGQ